MLQLGQRVTSRGRIFTNISHGVSFSRLLPSVRYGAGWGIWPGVRRFWGPGGPVTSSTFIIYFKGTTTGNREGSTHSLLHLSAG